MLYCDFGKDRHRVYPVDSGYAIEIANALKMRGYDQVETGADAPSVWVESDSVVGVYRKVGDGETLIFLGGSRSVTDRVVGALGFVSPGDVYSTRHLDRPE